MKPRGRREGMPIRGLQLGSCKDGTSKAFACQRQAYPVHRVQELDYQKLDLGREGGEGGLVGWWTGTRKLR